MRRSCVRPVCLRVFCVISDCMLYPGGSPARASGSGFRMVCSSRALIPRGSVSKLPSDAANQIWLWGGVFGRSNCKQIVRAQGQVRRAVGNNLFPIVPYFAPLLRSKRRCAVAPVARLAPFTGQKRKRPAAKPGSGRNSTTPYFANYPIGLDTSNVAAQLGTTFCYCS